MKTKRILMTSEKLIDKIDNCKSDDSLYVIYHDIISKKALEDTKFMSTITDGDSYFECGNNISFIRDAPIFIYKTLLKHIRKYENDSNLMNKLLPICLTDLKNKIEYYTNKDENVKIIKEIKI